MTETEHTHGNLELDLAHTHEEMESHQGHPHPHVHSYAHFHSHQPEDYQRLIHRMSRIIGHANSIKTMLEEQRDCSEVLVQISAVRSALNNLGKIILEEHIKECVVDVVSLDNPDEKDQVLHNLNDAIDKFIR